MTLCASSSSSTYSSSPPSFAKGMKLNAKNKKRTALLPFLLVLVFGIHVSSGTGLPFDHLPHGSHYDHGYGKHESAIPYEFGYTIKDGHGSSNFRKEAGDHDNNKWGSYGIQDKDGRWRLVHYVADKHGFRVKIDSNEPGLISHHPAHAIITGPDAYGHPHQHYPHHHGHHPEPHYPHTEPHYPHPEAHHHGPHHHGHGHRHEEHGYHHVRHEHHHKHHEPVHHHSKHDYFDNNIHDGHEEHVPHLPEPIHHHQHHGFEGHIHGPPEHEHHHPPPHPPQHHNPDSFLNFIPDVPMGPPEGTLDFKKAASGIIVDTVSSTTTTPSSQTVSAAIRPPSSSEATKIETTTPFTSKRIAAATEANNALAAKS